MDIEEQVRQIKQKLYLAMNGIASKGMRDNGISYKLNFGVELPRIKDIAASFDKDESLALRLWKENIRECKILAALLYPTELFKTDMANLWLDEILFVDLAEICSMYLFSRMEGASVAAFRWIADSREMHQYCGYITLAHLFKRKLEMNERYILEFSDQVKTAMSGKGMLTACAAKIALESFRNNYGDREPISGL